MSSIAFIIDYHRGIHQWTDKQLITILLVMLNHFEGDLIDDVDVECYFHEENL